MKKIISVILAAIMMLSVMTIAVSAASKPLNLTIVTDIHYSAPYSQGPVVGSTDENPWGHVISNGKLVWESEAIFDEFLVQVAANKPDYLVLTGDNCDTGHPDSMAGFVERMEAFEASTGVPVITLIGNHELYFEGFEPDEWKAAVWNLGYDLANAIDPDSCSFTVDIGDDYRLFMIDSNRFDNDDVEWIDAQVQKANEDGKKIISCTHHPIFAHYLIQDIAHASLVNKDLPLADKWIEWGIRFNFTGHTHELDIAEFKNDNGILYEIVGGALTTYPMAYRTVQFTDKYVNIDTKYIDKIDTTKLPTGYADEALYLLNSNLKAYAKKMFIEGMVLDVGYYVNANYLIAQAKLDEENDAVVCAALRKVIPLVREAIYGPLHGEGSLSEIAKEFNITIPESNYKSLMHVAANVYVAHCAGDEFYPPYSLEIQTAAKGLGATLSYALKDVSAEEYTAILTWAIEKFNLGDKIPVDIATYAGSAIKRAEGIEIVIGYAIIPLIDDFACDRAPSDIKTSLANYGSSGTGIMTLWEKFTNFILKILSYLTMFFNMFKTR